jgi:aryl-alcohol dehydrogenase-like predicted oxidoreductase
VPRRGVPGTGLELSVLGIDLDPERIGPPSADERTSVFLRRARQRGITTFRVLAGPARPRVERLLSTALPGADPSVVRIGARSFSELVREGARSEDPPGPDLSSRLEQSLRESAARLGGTGYRILEWEFEPGSGPSISEATGMLTDLRAHGSIDAFALPPEAAGEEGSSPAADRVSPALRTGALSLLDTRWATVLEAEARRRATGFLAHDPFAGGRLDGTAIGAAAGDRRPDSPPRSVRELHLEFDPVLRFEFLTRSHDRTLAEAALQFVLRWPWVTSVLVPLPSPERFDGLLRALNAPPLTDPELERVFALG